MKVNITTKSSADSSNLVFVMIPFSFWFVLNSAKWDTDAIYTQYLCDVPSSLRIPVTSQNSDAILSSPSIIGNVGNLETTDQTFSISKSIEIDSSTHYSFLLLKCDPYTPKTDINVKVDLQLINPNGQHLSTQKHPYILLFFVLMVAHGGLLIYLLFFFLKNRRHIYRLQILIAIGLVLQIISYSSVFTYFEYMNVIGQISDALDITLSVIGVFGETSFLLILFLLSLGYSITDEGMNPKVRLLFSVCFVGYLGSRLLYAFCNGSSICYIFFLSFKLLKFVITFGAIIAMNQTIDKLRIQSAEQQFSNDNQSEVFIKMKKYKAFRWAFLLYLIGPVISLFIQYTVITWVNYWVLTMVEEALVFYINCFIVKNFYPQPFNVPRAHQD
ncbi:hypothetical protein C9374_001246 [Naegleria lovaniensis]|uniref:GOST seven transmembrane domain-containing protein n=1 Tax=Naegleria lovaniensis TaxID=51637 RepID=A0AA88GRR7_NAELO|nr:uncharacterized protein C9374_001246 [Naegleria lovaniensis]KAG2387652.1 hypothetical protein C9374_001246 [Naegleria lovaniensis]